MKLNKTALLIACLLVLLQWLILPLGASPAANHIDVVLVIDDTRSMQWNDPDYIASLVIKKFVDKLATNGDQVGIVTYSIRALEVFPLTMIQGTSEVKDMKQFADTKLTQNGSGTDAAFGARTAVDMLATGRNSMNRQAVILISDGKNEFTAERTAEMSETDLAYVKASEIPVYTIGINPPGDEYRLYLDDLAAATGGKSYYIDDSAGLTDVVAELQALLLGLDSERNTLTVGPEGYVETLDIPENVFYANIQLDHEEPITIQLKDAAGNIIPFNNTNVLYTAEKQYSNIKLVEPAAGQIQLHITSDNRQLVMIDYVLNHEIYTNLTVSEINPAAGTEITIKAELMRGMDGYTEIPLGSLTAQAYTDSGESIPLTMQDSAFTGTVRFDSAGDISIYAVISGRELEFESKAVVVSVQNSAVSGAESDTTDTKDEDTTAESPSVDKPEATSSIWIWIAIAAGGVVLAVGLAVLLRTVRGNGPMNGKIAAIYYDGNYSKQWETYAVQLAGFGKSALLGDVIKNARMGNAYPFELNSVVISSMPKRYGVSIKIVNHIDYGTGDVALEKVLTAADSYQIELPDGGSINIEYTY